MAPATQPSGASTVLGVDGWKARWLGALLGDAGVLFLVTDRLVDLVAEAGDVAAVVVDVPIGTPLEGVRRADVEARVFMGPRRSSVFTVPPATVLRAASYQEALALARSQWGKGISSQAYALRAKIFEAGEFAREDERVFEGHPEVSFAAMKGSPLGYAKRAWNGYHERIALLAAAGIEIPERLSADVGRAPLDDVLDAAAMAWTARRVAAGEAKNLPNPPEEIDGRPVAIWY